jgi:hypothetical protein
MFFQEQESSHKNTSLQQEKLFQMSMYGRVDLNRCLCMEKLIKSLLSRKADRNLLDCSQARTDFLKFNLSIAKETHGNVWVDTLHQHL